MPNYFSETHHNVVAASVEFGAQYFYVCHAALPQLSESLADEYMLDNPFT